MSDKRHSMEKHLCWKCSFPAFCAKVPSASPSPGQELLFPWKRVFSRNKSKMSVRVCRLQGPLVLFCYFKASSSSASKMHSNAQIFLLDGDSPTHVLRDGVPGLWVVPVCHCSCGVCQGMPAASMENQGCSEAFRMKQRVCRYLAEAEPRQDAAPGSGAQHNIWMKNDNTLSSAQIDIALSAVTAEKAHRCHIKRWPCCHISFRHPSAKP